MIEWLLEPGLHPLGIVLIPAVGLLLVGYGLRGDRGEGGPRCPKCLYDMRGHLSAAPAAGVRPAEIDELTVAALACPECGHDFEDRYDLFRPRRHWRVCVGGLVLIAVWMCGFGYLVIIAVGWYPEQFAIRGLADRGNVVESLRIPGIKRTLHPRRSATGVARVMDRMPKGCRRLFGRITLVELLPPVSDADLARCGKLRHLQSLNVSDSPVTDAGLAHLEGLSQLKVLDLRGTQVTDAGLVHLKGSVQMERLILAGTAISDAGLAHLAGMRQLTDLDLSGTQVTGPGLVHLTALGQLRNLDLSRTPVTGPGLEHLTALRQLWHLNLSGTRLTDTGLAHLEEVRQVRHLSLPGTRVTDAAVVNLNRTRYDRDVRRLRNKPN